MKTNIDSNGETYYVDGIEKKKRVYRENERESKNV